MNQTNEQGVFITPQEELTESVYNNLIYKQKVNESKKEIVKFLEGLK
jgi:hypothetical protein